MTLLIVTICLAMLAIIIVQISRVRELSAAIRGEEEAQRKGTDRNGYGLVAFMVAFLVLTVGSAIYYRDYLIGYGPWSAASAHGGLIDSMINQTLFFTGISFVLTHIALFWFAHKYRETAREKADYISHDNRLEILWTAIPTVVMTYLVVGGLDVWNEVMADTVDQGLAEVGVDYNEIEATGYQFAWDIRYPGEDHLIGTKNFRLISATNPLGQDWEDPKNHDDFIPAEIVLPVNVPVRVRITSKDVLHNFYMPHFTVKMDAVPGMPTYFVFTPTLTTDSMRQRLRQEAGYQVPADESDPDGPERWELFDFELACAELCGKGHYSMRKIVRIVEQAEFEQWKKEQQSAYMRDIRNTDEDPFNGQPIQYELDLQRRELVANLTNAQYAVEDADRIVRLDNVTYETGSATLSPVSSYELDNVVEYLQQNGDVIFALAGHTDNVGDPELNRTLSQARADVVADYLIDNGISRDRMRRSEGFGESVPVGDNATEEGRAQNRRTEIIVVPAEEEAEVPSSSPAAAVM